MVQSWQKTAVIVIAMQITYADKFYLSSIYIMHFQTKLPYWSFGVFYGHAGAGSSLATVNQLQDIIHEKLHEIQDVIVCDEKNYGKLPVLQGAVAPTISFEAVVIGALEQSFLEMVRQA